MKVKSIFVAVLLFCTLATFDVGAMKKRRFSSTSMSKCEKNDQCAYFKKGEVITGKTLKWKLQAFCAKSYKDIDDHDVMFSMLGVDGTRLSELNSFVGYCCTKIAKQSKGSRQQIDCSQGIKKCLAHCFVELITNDQDKHVIKLFFDLKKDKSTLFHTCVSNGCYGLIEVITHKVVLDLYKTKNHNPLAKNANRKTPVEIMEDSAKAEDPDSFDEDFMRTLLVLKKAEHYLQQKQ